MVDNVVKSINGQYQKTEKTVSIALRGLEMKQNNGIDIHFLSQTSIQSMNGASEDAHFWEETSNLFNQFQSSQESIF